MVKAEQTRQYYQRGPTPAMQLPESSHPGTRTSRLNLDARAVSYALVWSAAFKHRAADSNNRVSRPTSHLAKIFCSHLDSNSVTSYPWGCGEGVGVRLRVVVRELEFVMVAARECGFVLGLRRGEWGLILGLRRRCSNSSSDFGEGVGVRLRVAAMELA